MQKTYQLKLYDSTGVYQKTKNPLTISSEVSFTSKVNGGQGECVVELADPIDDFDEGASIDHCNFAKIYEIDKENHPEPVLIYTGFISKYVPYFSGGNEGVRLVLLGLASLLSEAFYKNGSSFTVSHAAVDPSAIAAAIVSHFNSVYGTSWLSSGANVSTVGTNVTKDFVDQKWLPSMQAAVALAGTGWWWNIRETGELYFKAKPSAATHIFAIGREVESAEIEKSNEDVTNAVTLRWGGIPTIASYSDPTSIAAYGRREKIITDSTIGNATTADQRGNKEVADNKDPLVSAKVVVNAKYDLETLKPGDTVTIMNAKAGGNPFPANLMITSVSYSPDRCTLTLDKVRATAGDQLVDAIADAA